MKTQILGRIVLLLLFALPLTLRSQSPAGIESGPEPGLVRVKIVDGEFETLYSTLGDRLGDVALTPWLNPTLLRYALGDGAFFRPTPDRSRSFSFVSGIAGYLSLRRIYEVRFDASIDVDKVVTMLASLPEIEYAETVTHPRPLVIPNDPAVQSNQQWHHQVIGSFDAWDIIAADATAVIAITDTGVELDHPELVSAIWENPGESGPLSTNGIDDDNNGLVDDYRGYDFAGFSGTEEDNDPSPGNDDHGTIVAGIAAALSDNELGGAGVASGAKIIAIKIGGDQDSNLPGAYEGLLYGAAMGAPIINCSWGAPTYSRSEQELVTFVRQDLGAVIIAASGNKGLEIPFYPGSYNDVFSVAGSRPNDAKTGSSNYHHSVDLSAPGIDIYSTTVNGAFTIESGTSMAVPMASGAAALLMTQDPNLNASELEAILQASATNTDLLNAPYLRKLGSGRLNVADAVDGGIDRESGSILSIEVIEEDDNGAIDRNEEVRLAIRIRNDLAPASSMQLSVEPEVPLSVTIAEPNVLFESLDRGEIRETPESSVVLTFPDGIADDSRVGLWINLASADNSVWRYVALDVYPTWATTELNNISATFDGDGSIAYNGLDQQQGDGFYFRGKGSLLWHAGMMLGFSENSVADAVRVGPKSMGLDDDLELVSPYRLTRPSPDLEIGTGRYNVAASFGREVEIALETREEAGTPNGLLVVYNVTNNGATRIDDLYCGLYLDWDLLTTGSFDQASFDEEYRLGFVRNAVDPDLTTGVALLGDLPINYYAVDNADDRIASDFSDAKKWSYLSSGVLRETTRPDIDAGMVIGAGPFDLEPGEQRTVPFAFVGASTHDSLRSTTDSVRSLYQRLLGVSGNGNTTEAEITVVYEGAPGRAGLIRIARADGRSLPERIFLYDVEGRVVGVIPTERNVEIQYRADQLGTGTYFVGIPETTETQRTSRTIHIVR